jgi:DNA-binding transcriptional LysR family regulator
MRTMTLEQLRIFVAVAERLHVTRAAEALHLTQSAASAAIAALERRHGVTVFDRVGRRLALTEAGRALLPEARQLLQNAAHAESVLGELAGLKRGALTVAASQTVSGYWLPERLARFARLHPAVRLTMHAGNTAQMAQAVIDGAADLGFVEGGCAGRSFCAPRSRRTASPFSPARIIRSRASASGRPTSPAPTGSCARKAPAHARISKRRCAGPASIRRGCTSS